MKNKGVVENPWCVCKIADGRPVQIGKIESFVKGSSPGFARVQRRENDQFPSAWNTKYIECFATPEEAIVRFSKISRNRLNSIKAVFLRRFHSEKDNLAA